MLTPAFIKERIKHGKKKAAKDETMGEAWVSCLCFISKAYRPQIGSCIPGQGKYHFHFVDLGTMSQMSEDKACTHPSLWRINLLTPPFKVIADFNFAFLMDYCATFAGRMPTKREVEASCFVVAISRYFSLDRAGLSRLGP